jgi:hypothetical protein
MTQNCSLLRLNLACSSLNDFGGQAIAESLGTNAVIEEVNCAQNQFRQVQARPGPALLAIDADAVL